MFEIFARTRILQGPVNVFGETNARQHLKANTSFEKDPIKRWSITYPQRPL